MTPTDAEMIALIHETKAVSIWNRETGPVFWYAAGVPGPFYVNTERVIGPELAEQLLEGITAIVTETTSSHERARRLTLLVMAAYEKDMAYQNVIAALAARAEAEFPSGRFDIISGGERRDWLFSIPLAHRLNVQHVFLFKNRGYYCATDFPVGAKALHVADLINNAASYFDAWFPILSAARLDFAGTLCVNTRGANGLKRLKDHGSRVVALNRIDVDFFAQSCADGLISPSTLEELSVYFQSAEAWAERYLLSNPHVFDAGGVDVKSFGRLQEFVRNDPWNLRDRHPAFFTAMEKSIQQRLEI